jgi:hypothetical protein
MPLSPSTIPRPANQVYVHAPRAEQEDPTLRDRLARLAALAAPTACQAALLALMVRPASRRERAAFADLTVDLPETAHILDDVLALPRAAKLPWFEHFARQLAPGPVEQRHDVIDDARRIMAADGKVSPLDKLRWIALRHLLAGNVASSRVASDEELATLHEWAVRQACIYNAFLSQLVPAPELTLDVSDGAALGAIWYDKVTAVWQDRPGIVPPRAQYDIDATLGALRALQGLPWMLRPVLVRAWFEAARELTDGPALHPDAADALRLTCVLLDSPLPPELGRQYMEVEPVRD